MIEQRSFLEQRSRRHPRDFLSGCTTPAEGVGCTVRYCRNRRFLRGIRDFSGCADTRFYIRKPLLYPLSYRRLNPTNQLPMFRCFLTPADHGPKRSRASFASSAVGMMTRTANVPWPNTSVYRPVNRQRSPAPEALDDRSLESFRQALHFVSQLAYFASWRFSKVKSARKAAGQGE